MFRRRMVCSTTSILQLLLLLCRCSIASFAQETPAIQVETFDASEVLRQNVCERQVLLHNGTVQLRDALKGIQLRPRVSGEVKRDADTGAINADYPGIIGVLLDELALRGGFTWRDSYGIGTGGRRYRTFDELLEWSVEHFDLMAGGWTETLERMNRGIIFPEGWRDGSIIMVGLDDSKQSELDIWSFLEPFTAGLWTMIGVTIVVSGLVYYALERFNPDSDVQVLTRPSQSIYLTALSFTQQSDFQPQTNYARVFTWSLMFWSLIMASAYTANLASFLVIDNTPAIQIKTLGDAVRLGFPLCVWATTADDRIVSTAYPQAKLVRKTNYQEIFDGIRQGECRLAVSSLSDWESHKQLSEVNGDCTLIWIGRVFKFVQTGFATVSDSGTLCTSLIRDVIDLHMKEMKEEGVLDREWKSYLERSADVDCESEADLASEDGDSIRLSLRDMAGLFIFHGILTGVAVVMFVFTAYFDRKKCRFVKREPKGKSRRQAAASITDAQGIETDDDMAATAANDGVPVSSSVVVSEQASDARADDQELLELRDQMRKWAALLDEKVQQQKANTA